jgi:cell division protein FtsB
MMFDKQGNRSPLLVAGLLIFGTGIFGDGIFGRAVPASAQTTATVDERIKALEQERDELKKQNGLLELRLKQLQASVNKQVTDALGPNVAAGQGSATPPAPHPPGEPPVTTPPSAVPFNYLQAAPWRTGPPFTRTAGLFSPLQSPVDLVSLAVGYQDALAQLRTARQKRERKDKETADVQSAESKVKLLRSMTQALREQLAGEVDRMHKLSAIHAVPTMDVRNLDTKLQILDLILAQDPDAGPGSKEPPADKTATPAKAG